MKKMKIHFVGIKGVGMTPMAIICKQAGHEITGSDVPEEFITDKVLSENNIFPYKGFSMDHVIGKDLIIFTGAHGGLDNEEVKEAQRLGIPVWSHGEAVGELMKGNVLGRSFDGISIAGCHGKTTTTGIVATLLEESKLDPTYIIGTSEIASLKGPGNLGKGKYFVVEADEYATDPKYDKKPRFLWQNPKIAIFTNIELDHPDLYSSLSEIKEAFSKFLNNIKADGLLICNGDDKEIEEIIKDHGNVVAFGKSPKNDFIISKISISESQTFFWVQARGVSLGQFSIKLIGEHNAYNALAAIALGVELGIPVEKIKKGLEAFKGSKRRFEYVGRLKSGALLFDDYAHHPTEIKKTLQGIRQAYKKFKIVCVFQPHTYSRTKKLFEQFISSFNDADELILSDIFPSKREAVDTSISSKLLSDKISLQKKNVYYLPSLADVVEYIDKKNYDRDTLIIIMGAGDIYKVKEGLDYDN